MNSTSKLFQELGPPDATSNTRCWFWTTLFEIRRVYNYVEEAEEAEGQGRIVEYPAERLSLSTALGKVSRTGRQPRLSKLFNATTSKFSIWIDDQCPSIRPAFSLVYTGSSAHAVQLPPPSRISFDTQDPATQFPTNIYRQLIKTGIFTGLCIRMHFFWTAYSRPMGILSSG